MNAVTKAIATVNPASVEDRGWTTFRGTAHRAIDVTRHGRWYKNDDGLVAELRTALADLPVAAVRQWRNGTVRVVLA
jgi:hypothetical protein